jgi:hypothetical protein
MASHSPRREPRMAYRKGMALRASSPKPTS